MKTFFISTLCRVILLLLLNFTGVFFSNAQISGIVFRDFNGNGSRENTSGTYVEPGVAGIQVRAYNSSDMQIGGTKTSASNGVYSFSAAEIPANTPVRLEFVIPASGTVADAATDFSSASGNVYGTSVQFVTAGASAVNVNYAINNPADFINPNSTFSNIDVFIPSFVFGNPTASPAGTAASQRAFVKFPYNSSGYGTFGTSSILATASQIGSVWGVAYSKQANRVFTSAYLRRHAGLGPANGNFNNAPGAIYIINPTLNSTTGAATYFTSLDALGVPTHNSTGSPAYGNGTSFTVATSGTGHTRSETISYTANGLGVVGINTQRGLGANINSPSNDAAAWDQVGKVGLGDIEISDDGRFLFVTNLFDRRVYMLQLNSVTNPTGATVVNSWALPNPPLRSASGIPNAGNTYTGAANNTDFYSGNRGLQRPFGLKFYRGKLYIGAVTTGEGTSASSIKENFATPNPEYTDLWAYVWVLQPQTGSFTSMPLVQMPLNFDRGINTDGADETWRVWTRTMEVPQFVFDGRGFNVQPQPMLSGIEFDVDGSLILAVRDRGGDQMSFEQYMLTGTSVVRYTTALGDIMRVYKNPSTGFFENELNGREGQNSLLLPTAGANNLQGPGIYGSSLNQAGEFYFQDHIYAPGFINENFQMNVGEGALALLPGRQEVMNTQIDPLDLWTNGVALFSNSTGEDIRDFQVMGSGEALGRAGKSNGLGDIELTGFVPPVEIGNRVWRDSDGDGIQDAGEPGIAGVEIELVDAGTGTVIATCTTNANGNFLFISGGSSVTGTGTVACAMFPETNYIVRVKGTVLSNGVNQVSGNAYNFVANVLFLTRANSTGNGQQDWSDNDGVTTSNRYQVTVTTGTWGQNNHHIDFGFAPMHVLPQSGITLSAVEQSDKKSVLLEWAVEQELSALTYIIERSSDGYSFESIGTATHKLGITSYQFQDNTPLNGTNLYRVAIRFSDGSRKYSNIKTIYFSQSAVQMEVFPNPVMNQLILKRSQSLQELVTVKLFNSSGQLVRNVRFEKGAPVLQLSVTDLLPGYYIINLSGEDKTKFQTHKIVKQ